MIKFLEPREIFTLEKLRDGEVSEYPLDFLTPKNCLPSYFIPNHGRIPEKLINCDYIHVPTYEIGTSIDFPIDSKEEDVFCSTFILMQTLTNKINHDCLSLLKYAHKKVTSFSKSCKVDEDKLLSDLSKEFSGNIKFVKYIENNTKYIYAVEKAEDVLMMPVRIEPEINIDPTIKNRKGFWSYTELGLAALKPIGHLFIMPKLDNELNSAEQSMLKYEYLIGEQFQPYLGGINDQK